MKIGILTSSRADYGIYLPLLNKLRANSFFSIRLLVFGTHLSDIYGYTIRQIESDGFIISHRLETAPIDDKPSDISKSMALTINKFNDIWDEEVYDLIFALGDRYEMFAAVASTIPYNIPVAHIHGGETTLGAIDNSFRHSITIMSDIHFTVCEEYKRRVIELLGNDERVYNVGALSIDNLSKMSFLTKEEFYLKYSIDLEKRTILFTFHPETVSYQNNEKYITTIIETLSELKGYQVVITMPNADTQSNVIRKHLVAFCEQRKDAFAIETFGSQGYLSCMKYCTLMMGNSSSGFIEASWFPKAVINLGERQTGRILTPNIKSCRIEKKEILDKVSYFENNTVNVTENFYGDGNTSDHIIKIIKDTVTINQ